MLGSLLPKGKDKNIEQIISLPEIVQAPIEEKQKLGEVKYVLDGETIAITDIIADREVKKISLGNMVDLTLSLWFNLLR